MSAVADRRRRGTDHAAAKLTDEQIVEIRETYARGGVTQVDLAEAFGVAQSLISGIVNGHRWPHVDGPIRRKKPLAE